MSSYPIIPQAYYGSSAQKEDLQEVCSHLAKFVGQREDSYKGSWNKEGGLGVYFNLKRKIDRIQNWCDNYGKDLWAAVEATRGSDTGILHDIFDLMGYCALIQATVRQEAQGEKAFSNYSSTLIEKTKIKQLSQEDNQPALLEESMFPLSSPKTRGPLIPVFVKTVDDKPLDKPQVDALMGYINKSLPEFKDPEPPKEYVNPDSGAANPSSSYPSQLETAEQRKARWDKEERLRVEHLALIKRAKAEGWYLESHPFFDPMNPGVYTPSTSPDTRILVTRRQCDHCGIVENATADQLKEHGWTHETRAKSIHPEAAPTMTRVDICPKCSPKAAS